MLAVLLFHVYSIIQLRLANDLANRRVSYCASLLSVLLGLVVVTDNS